MAPEWARSPLPSGSRPCPLPKRPPQHQARPAGGIPEGEAEPHPRDGHKAGLAGGKTAPGRPLSPLPSPPLPGGGPGRDQEPQKPHSGIGYPSGGRKGPSTSASSRGAAPEFPRDLGDRIRGSPGGGGANRTVRPLEGRGPLSCEGSQAPPFLSSSPQKRRAWLLRLGPSSQATAFPLLPRPLRLISAPSTERAPSLTAVSGPSEASDSAPPPPTTKTTLARRRTRPF